MIQSFHVPFQNAQWEGKDNSCMFLHAACTTGSCKKGRVSCSVMKALKLFSQSPFAWFFLKSLFRSKKNNNKNINWWINVKEHKYTVQDVPGHHAASVHPRTIREACMNAWAQRGWNKGKSGQGGLTGGLLSALMCITALLATNRSGL